MFIASLYLPVRRASVLFQGNFALLRGWAEGSNLKVRAKWGAKPIVGGIPELRHSVQVSHTPTFSRDTPIMLKITDITGAINQTIPSEVAKCVGVWADMVNSEHSRDDDNAVHPILLLAKS
jgi:hypothetical protein